MMTGCFCFHFYFNVNQCHPTSHMITQPMIISKNLIQTQPHHTHTQNLIQLLQTNIQHNQATPQGDLTSRDE